MDDPTTIERIAELRADFNKLPEYEPYGLRDTNMGILFAEIDRLQAELTQAQDLLAKVQDGLTQQLYEAMQPKWISAKEKSPKQYQDVLGFLECKECCVVRYSHENGCRIRYYWHCISYR